MQSFHDIRKFPDASKIAKVNPLFKQGSKTDSSNYRPISLLPLLSKVFERVDSFSEVSSISCGVPQGSILVPLLFLMIC